MAYTLLRHQEHIKCSIKPIDSIERTFRGHEAPRLGNNLHKESRNGIQER